MSLPVCILNVVGAFRVLLSFPFSMEKLLSVCEFLCWNNCRPGWSGNRRKRGWLLNYFEIGFQQPKASRPANQPASQIVQQKCVTVHDTNVIETERDTTERIYLSMVTDWKEGETFLLHIDGKSVRGCGKLWKIRGVRRNNFKCLNDSHLLDTLTFWFWIRNVTFHFKCRKV